MKAYLLLLEILAKVIPALVDWRDRIRKELEEKNAQAERDKLAVNPSNWFNDHFSNELQSNSGKKDALETNKANTDNPKK